MRKLLDLVWWLELLLHPIRALDLVDREGKPDHGKIFPAITLVVFLVLTVRGQLPDIGTVLALLCASHGYAGLRTVLRSRSGQQ